MTNESGGGMSEWIIQNSYLETKEGLKSMGVLNTHTELDQKIVGQLAAITEYLATNGIDKISIGCGVWMTSGRLEKEKKEYLSYVIEKGQEGTP